MTGALGSREHKFMFTLFCRFFLFAKSGYLPTEGKTLYPDIRRISEEIEKEFDPYTGSIEDRCYEFCLQSRSIVDCRPDPLGQRRHFDVVSWLVGRPLDGVNSKLNRSLNRNNDET